VEKIRMKGQQCRSAILCLGYKSQLHNYGL